MYICGGCSKFWYPKTVLTPPFREPCALFRAAAKSIHGIMIMFCIFRIDRGIQTFREPFAALSRSFATAAENIHSYLQMSLGVPPSEERGRFGTRDNSHFGTHVSIVNLERGQIIKIIIIIIISHHPSSSIIQHPTSIIHETSSVSLLSTSLSITHHSLLSSSSSTIIIITIIIIIIHHPTSIIRQPTSIIHDTSSSSSSSTRDKP